MVRDIGMGEGKTMSTSVTYVPQTFAISLRNFFNINSLAELFWYLDCLQCSR